MVLCVCADIADMGKCKCDDLPGIGRVCHDFLIAGHRGIETDLAYICGGSAKANAGTAVTSSNQLIEASKGTATDK